MDGVSRHQTSPRHATDARDDDNEARYQALLRRKRGSLLLGQQLLACVGLYRPPREDLEALPDACDGASDGNGGHGTRPWWHYALAGGAAAALVALLWWLSHTARKQDRAHRLSSRRHRLTEHLNSLYPTLAHYDDLLSTAAELMEYTFLTEDELADTARILQSMHNLAVQPHLLQQGPNTSTFVQWAALFGVLRHHIVQWRTRSKQRQIERLRNFKCDKFRHTVKERFRVSAERWFAVCENVYLMHRHKFMRLH